MKSEETQDTPNGNHVAVTINGKVLVSFYVRDQPTDDEASFDMLFELVSLISKQRETRRGADREPLAFTDDRNEDQQRADWGCPNCAGTDYAHTLECPTPTPETEPR